MDTPLPDSQALPPGTQLEEFVIERVLGSGGFGITYLARDTSLGRQVVIKENLPSQFAWRETSTGTVRPRHTTGSDIDDYEWSLKNFLREAETLAALDHPGIVRVLRKFQANGTAYFVMPFVEGVAFDSLIEERSTKNKYFSQDELLGLTIRMLGALGYLQVRGIYHRDIKPGNILITRDGIPVLIDFGSARQSLSDRSMTVIESPGYTPFEQTESRGNVGPWSDLYALGGVLRKAITGQTPPRSSDRIRRDPMTPLAADAALHNRFSESFLAAIDKAMAVDERDRWQDAQEWNDWICSNGERMERQQESGGKNGNTADKPANAGTAGAEASGGQDCAPDGPQQANTAQESDVGEKLLKAKAKKKSSLAPVLGVTLVCVVGVVGGVLWLLRERERISEDVPKSISPSVVERGEFPNTESKTRLENKDSTPPTGNTRPPEKELAVVSSGSAPDPVAVAAEIPSARKPVPVTSNPTQPAAKKPEPKEEPAPSKFEMAVQFEKGQGRKRDMTKAFEMYDDAAREGVVEAAFHAGLMLEEGRGCKKNEYLALVRYRKAAESGHPGAQVNLGIMYAQGRGCDPDDAEAVKWYQRGALQNDTDAMVLLGMMHDFGLGTPENSKEASRLYQIAADQGDGDAKKLLEGIKK